MKEFLHDPLYDADGVQVSSGIGVDGKEYPDPVPTAPPVGYRQGPSLSDMIQRMIQSERLRQLADEQGFDSPDEADDFDVDDDFDPRTPYEEHFMPPVQAAPAAPAPTEPPKVEPAPPPLAPSSGDAETKK